MELIHSSRKLLVGVIRDDDSTDTINCFIISALHLGIPIVGLHDAAASFRAVDCLDYGIVATEVTTAFIVIYYFNIVLRAM
jgi:hypothetical protein